MINIKNSKCKIYNDAHDVILVAGQSNAYGYGKGDGIYDNRYGVKILFKKTSYINKKHTKFPARQYVYKNAGLNQNKTNAFSLYFAERYCNELLEDGRKLLILRTAVGGTGFADGHWGLKDKLYLNTLDMARQLLIGNPKNRIIAVLWHQGESDVLAGAAKDYYKAKFCDLINGLRNELNMVDVPFIAGDLSQEWYITQGKADNVREATREVIAELDNCAYVSSDGLGGNPGNDNIHFSAEANKVLGERYYEAYKSLIE